MKPDLKITSVILLILIFLVDTNIAHSQSSIVSGMSENPCPEQTSSGAPPEYLKAMMEPGAKMPPMPKPGDPQFVAMMKTREESRNRDFADLCRFKEENNRIANQPVKVVFIGDSITAGWEVGDAPLFSDGNVNRGIGGQTSPQMLQRFYQDVVALHPRAVHIMAGTNDLAGNTGPNSPEDFKNNIRAMVDLARANNIKVVLASILPVTSFPWQPESKPEQLILSLNAWLKQFAAERGLVYADYYAVTVSANGELNSALSNDGVHPHREGYAAMRAIALRSINEVLSLK